MYGYHLVACLSIFGPKFRKCMYIIICISELIHRESPHQDLPLLEFALFPDD